MARTRSPKPSSPRPKRPLSDFSAPTAKGGKSDGTKKDPCPPVHWLHDQPPQKGAGAGGARPERRDQVGKKPGRGAYLCPNPDCLTKAKKKKALERCFEQPVPAEVYDALARQLAAVEQEAAQDGKE